MKSRERGSVSLVELTIAMVLVVIIMTPLTLLFGSTIRGFFSQNPPPIAMQTVYDAVGEIGDNLRESGNITAANNTSVTFRASPADITYRLNTTHNVIERVQSGSITYIPYYNTPTVRNKVSLNLTFDYFSKNNVVWPGNNTVEISSININLTASLDNYTIPIRERVTLRVK